ncbi:acyl-CoA thioesterase domain-containing protein [Lentzea sp. NPDC042327]|uniref:acyl-CoA thioesterase domain-containing protein n=1 Tax=Lentzea sp. NPDC042327 TaxID=3154801 RepID=UPI0033CF11CB
MKRDEVEGDRPDRRSPAGGDGIDEPAELARLVRAGDGMFRRHPVRPDEGSAVFGGQLLCQALLAAGAALPATMSAASLRMHFLRPGNLCDPAECEVIPAVDQADRVVFEATASQNDRRLAVAVAAFGEVIPGSGPRVSRTRGLGERMSVSLLV